MILREGLECCATPDHQREPFIAVPNSSHSATYLPHANNSRAQRGAIRGPLENLLCHPLGLDVSIARGNFGRDCAFGDWLSPLVV